MPPCGNCQACSLTRFPQKTSFRELTRTIPTFGRYPSRSIMTITQKLFDLTGFFHKAAMKRNGAAFAQSCPLNQQALFGMRIEALQDLHKTQELEAIARLQQASLLAQFLPAQLGGPALEPEHDNV